MDHWVQPLSRGCSGEIDLWLHSQISKLLSSLAVSVLFIKVACYWNGTHESWKWWRRKKQDEHFAYSPSSHVICFLSCFRKMVQRSLFLPKLKAGVGWPFRCCWIIASINTLIVTASESWHLIRLCRQTLPHPWCRGNNTKWCQILYIFTEQLLLEMEKRILSA